AAVAVVDRWAVAAHELHERETVLELLDARCQVAHECFEIAHRSSPSRRRFSALPSMTGSRGNAQSFSAIARPPASSLTTTGPSARRARPSRATSAGSAVDGPNAMPRRAIAGVRIAPTTNSSTCTSLGRSSYQRPSANTRLKALAAL